MASFAHSQKKNIVFQMYKRIFKEVFNLQITFIPLKKILYTTHNIIIIASLPKYAPFLSI